MRFSLYCVILLSISTSAQAFGPCDDDTKNLCQLADCPADAEENCLYQKISSVKDVDCKSFLKKNQKKWQNRSTSFEKIKKQCRQELDEFCDDVMCKEGSFKSIQVCLMTHKSKLTEPCKAEINRHIRAFQPNILELK